MLLNDDLIATHDIAVLALHVALNRLTVDIAVL